MRRGFLDVAQRHPGVERGGDERVPQRVGRDGLGDHRADELTGDLPDQTKVGRKLSHEIGVGELGRHAHVELCHEVDRRSSFALHRAGGA